MRFIECRVYAVYSKNLATQHYECLGEEVYSQRPTEEEMILLLDKYKIAPSSDSYIKISTALRPVEE